MSEQDRIKTELWSGGPGTIWMEEHDDGQVYSDNNDDEVGIYVTDTSWDDNAGTQVAFYLDPLKAVQLAGQIRNAAERAYGSN